MLFSSSQIKVRIQCNSNKIYEIYILDQESQQQFTNIIQELSGYEGNVRRDHGYESFYHVSGEQIQMGITIFTKTSNRKGKSIYLLTSWKFAFFFLFFNIAVFVVPVLLFFLIVTNLISIEEAKMV